MLKARSHLHQIRHAINLTHCKIRAKRRTVVNIEQELAQLDLMRLDFIQQRNTAEFELMNQVSHRRFCKLMGYKNGIY